MGTNKQKGEAMKMRPNIWLSKETEMKQPVFEGDLLNEYVARRRACDMDYLRERSEEATRLPEGYDPYEDGPATRFG
jgi:hypothetical protein